MIMALSQINRKRYPGKLTNFSLDIARKNGKIIQNAVKQLVDGRQTIVGSEPQAPGGIRRDGPWA